MSIDFSTSFLDKRVDFTAVQEDTAIDTEGRQNVSFVEMAHCLFGASKVLGSLVDAQKVGRFR